MKHLLAMVKPFPDCKGHKASMIELDYLRLIYAVGEMRRQCEDAQGYFVVIADEIPRRMSKWEHAYQGNRCVEMISTSPASYVRHPAGNEKTANLSGMVTAAILDKSGRQSYSSIRRSIEDCILAETILALEPNVQRIRDESRFPLGIRWDYYGVVEK
ncbi:MAG: hypothetical protein HYX80_01510 [Chloroflexi bacterium]|nr:hypothetical protein [Chloroflexota bacterium]